MNSPLIDSVGMFPTCDALCRAPGMVLNRQGGSSYIHGRVWREKLVHAPYRASDVMKREQGVSSHIHGRVREAKLAHAPCQALDMVKSK